MKTKKAEVKYVTKKNCKQFHGKGEIVRTLPKPAMRFRCECVKEIKVDKVEKSDDVSRECVENTKEEIKND